MGNASISSAARAFIARNGAIVRGAEFTVVAGFAVAGWAAGEDMILAIPLLIASFAIGMLCIVTAPSLSYRRRWIGSIALCLFLLAEGGFLYWHTAGRYPESSVIQSNGDKQLDAGRLFGKLEQQNADLLAAIKDDQRAAQIDRRISRESDAQLDADLHAVSPNPADSEHQANYSVVNGRHLTTEQKRALKSAVASLLTNPKNYGIAVAQTDGVTETEGYANDFYEVLTRAGLPGVGSPKNYSLHLFEPHQGEVSIGVSDKNSPPKYAEQLRDALAAGGIRTEFINAPPNFSHSIVLFIGPRPL